MSCNFLEPNNNFELWVASLNRTYVHQGLLKLCKVSIPFIADTENTEVSSYEFKIEKKIHGINLSNRNGGTQLMK